MKKIQFLENFSLIVPPLVTFGLINIVHAVNQKFTLKGIEHIPVKGYTNDIHAVGDKIYLIDWFEEFLVYDVSNSTNPSLLGSYECASDINSAVKGTKTFLVTGDNATLGLSSENGKKQNEV